MTAWQKYEQLQDDTLAKVGRLLDDTLGQGTAALWLLFFVIIDGCDVDTALN